MSDCIFCQIATGAAPASIIHEDDQALVLLDLFPVREGHVLIIPRQHGQYVEEFDDASLAHLMSLARRTIIAQKAVATKNPGMVIRGHNLIINDGKAANQHVPHLHLHVVPRQGGDSLAMALTWATRMMNVFGVAARRERLDRLAGLLREHFPAE
ncbi:HIT family protein [Alcanivorax sp. S71-1-4]|uniref:HIT family protein n=1 Tax=Isoalcanivorax pacificus W11-5 TaxID=391936 RepID=A0A0B4XQ57_9GAMM|nr:MULTISPECIES: HIT family protein [Alcanivoracaceae]AJD48573.1 HIT family protein [Isoalcanivorax pacificus W11-5]KAF0809782.1 HIT family protein [Alcanivorax sp. S71-1-4]